MKNSWVFARISDATELLNFFEVADEEGLIGFGTFFLTVESTLLGITTGSGFAFGGLPLFRGAGVGLDLDMVVGAFVVMFFEGRPRFLPADRVVVAAMVVDLNGLPRFRCSVISTEFATAFGVRTRLRGDNEAVGVDSCSSLNFGGRPLPLFSETSAFVALVAAADGVLVVVSESLFFLLGVLRFELSVSLSASAAPACIIEDNARRFDNSLGVAVALVLTQVGQYHF